MDNVMFQMYNNYFVPDFLHMSSTHLSQATLINSQLEGVRGTWHPTVYSIIHCLYYIFGAVLDHSVERNCAVELIREIR